MAEVVRWSSRKATQLFSRRDPGPEHVEVREKVSVRSIRAGGRMDVSVLRDMVAALDLVEVPSRAPVEFVMVDGRVSQLVVEVDLDPEVPAAVGGEQPAPGGGG